MDSFIVFNYTFFCLFIIAYIIISCTAFTCIHDEVTDLKTPSTYTRSVKFQDIRSERAKDASYFEPLRIHFYMDEMDPSVSTNAIYNIEIAVRKLRDFISETFQVRIRGRPFLLNRKGCIQTWQSGKNRGKCSKFKSEENICAAKEVAFQIPASFLDKVELYDFDESWPRYTIQQGTGLLDSNFVTFITSRATNACEGTDVLAYGAYCKVDPRTNEPLAGILNLCPNYFAKKLYSAEHYYNVLLHELFHILGFSFHQFENFLPCEKGTYCEIPKNIIVEDLNGIGRLSFPLVIESMREHFSCSDVDIDFGGPMAVFAEGENSTGNMYSSHWHPLLMYSSIMSPKFSEDDHIHVDNITLAAFASTGWYRVNFSMATTFRFGKAAGCDFGVDKNCNNSEYLCNPSTDATGCDFMHETIGKCMQVVPYHPCGIYQPLSEAICKLDEERQFGIDFRALSYKQRCFLIQESETVSKPICLPMKCQSTDSYTVFVDMTWKECRMDTQFIETDNGTLFCPLTLDFCTGSSLPSSRSFCTEENQFFISVRMNFGQPTFIDLSTNNNFKNFKVTVLRGVASKMDIPVNYIINATLTVFKIISMDFAICPPVSDDTVRTVIQRVQKFLDGGDFISILKAPKNMLISSSDIVINPSYAIAFSDHEGFRTLVIIPVIFAVFIIATITASIARLFIIQKHKPQRIEESTEPGDAELSDVKTTPS